MHIIYAIIFIYLGLNHVNAQTLSFVSDDPDQPIEVSAETGIEWQQERRLFIARGSAKATQGDVQVNANQIIAHYRETIGSRTDVYRVDAVGDVTIRSPGEVVTGSAAVYDFEKAVLVMQGAPVRLETVDSVIIAENTIQYWEKENVAVADGPATALREEQKLVADQLTARFKDSKLSDAKGLPVRSNELSMIQGFGNVHFESNNDIVKGDRGKYNLETGIATVDGNVSITSDQNQLSGGFAVIDTNSGINQLFMNSKQAGLGPIPSMKRVRALIAPRPLDTAPPTMVK
ncbi:MAG: hypothetical protein CMM25_08790 [Rhodospirillaceae bacterium]|nr:hypothetical protein [Rhodospirillaceae bacterium]|tara:strand:+ start:223 stop:1089 length:867 start_codon:yes stop_codon:yes gene_type:complete